jgi:choline dehydrogenase-like flavoprotein
LYREGPVCNLFEVAGFLRSSESESFPDIRLTFYALGYLKTAEGGYQMAPYPAVMVSLQKSYPKSRGRIRLASKVPDVAPIIECPLLEERADVDTLIRGIRIIRGIMQREPIAKMIREETVPGSKVRDEVALEDFIRTHTGIPYHSVGSCRMGMGPDAVVDPRLRVRGMQNLWIADASIMPHHISADTNATSMLIGAKLGQQLAGR